MEITSKYNRYVRGLVRVCACVTENNNRLNLIASVSNCHVQNHLKVLQAVYVLVHVNLNLG